YDETKLQLSLAHDGLPLETDPAQASHSDGTSSEKENFPSAQDLALQLLNYYSYSVESKTKGEHAILVMTFQSERKPERGVSDLPRPAHARRQSHAVAGSDRNLDYTRKNPTAIGIRRHSPSNLRTGTTPSTPELLLDNFEIH